MLVVSVESKESCHLKCLVLSEAEHEDTDTSPKHIITWKVQVIITQMHTSNGSSESRVTCRASGIPMVIGGGIGRL